MDEFDLIEEAVNYLQCKSYPDECTENLKRSIRRKSKQLVSRNGELFYLKNRKDLSGEKVAVELKYVGAVQERNRIIRACHNDPTSGHMGIKKTANRVAERFFWKGVSKDVENFVLACDLCQKNTKKLEISRPVLNPVPVHSPWLHVAIDFVGPIAPASKHGNRYILTLSDYFTKWVEAVPLPSKEASGVAQTLFKIFMRMGIPRILTSDQGSEFKNSLNEDLMKLLGIKHHLTTAYHPQANGLDERFNQTLQNMLRKYAFGRKDDWDMFLDTCTFAYNTSRHESTLFSPFEVMYGRKPILPIDIDTSKPNAAELLEEQKTASPDKSLDSLSSHRQNLLVKVKSNILHAQQKQKEQYDKRHSISKFEVGASVLKKDFTRKKRKGGKLDPKWLGPYQIKEDLGKGLYKLEAVESPGRVLERVNGSHLKLYHKPQRSQTPSSLSPSKSPSLPRSRSPLSRSSSLPKSPSPHSPSKSRYRSLSRSPSLPKSPSLHSPSKSRSRSPFSRSASLQSCKSRSQPSFSRSSPLQSSEFRSLTESPNIAGSPSPSRRQSQSPLMQGFPSLTSYQSTSKSSETSSERYQDADPNDLVQVLRKMSAEELVTKFSAIAPSRQDILDRKVTFFGFNYQQFTLTTCGKRNKLKNASDSLCCFASDQCEAVLEYLISLIQPTDNIQLLAYVMDVLFPGLLQAFLVDMFKITEEKAVTVMHTLPKPTKRRNSISAEDFSHNLNMDLYEEVKKRRKIDLTNAKVNCPKTSYWISDLRLSPDDLKFLRGNDWLTDNIINAAQSLLQQQFPSVCGLQNSLLGSTLGYDVMRSDFIQIMLVNQNHWITVAYQDKCIYVYDSSPTRFFPTDGKAQIAALLNSDLKQLKICFKPVQRQNGTQDCGLFAIAYAHTICCGIDPTVIHFEQKKMRSHLIQCLENQRLTLFPSQERRPPKVVPKVITIEIFCHCRQINKGKMVECSTCKEWFHDTCVKIPRNLKRSSEWYCRTCLR